MNSQVYGGFLWPALQDGQEGLIERPIQINLTAT